MSSAEQEAARALREGLAKSVARRRAEDAALVERTMASLRFLHQSDPIGTKVWMPACKGRESSDDGKPLVFEGVSSGYETNMAKLRGEGREDIIRAPFWMCVVLGEVTP